MRCGRVRGLLVPYLDGQLNPRRHRAVERHVDGCGDCAEDARLIRRLYGLLDAPALPRVPPQLEARLMERIRTSEAEAPPERAWWWAVPVTLAAGIAGLAAGVALERVLLSQPPVVRRGPEQVLVSPQASVDTGAAIAAVAADPETLASLPASPVGTPDTDPFPEHSAQPRETLAAGPTDALPGHLRDALNLFVDYPIIRNLEKFEHYETIEAARSRAVEGTRGG